MSSNRGPVRLAAVKRHITSSAPVMAANSGGKEVGVTLDENTDKVLYENVGSTRIYKLNRPKALNALDWDMIASLAKNAQVSRRLPNRRAKLTPDLARERLVQACHRPW